MYVAYLVACTAAYLVPTSLGENVVRLRYAAIPIAILTLSLRRWRPLPLAVLVLSLAVAWNVAPLAGSYVRANADPAADPAYWAPAVQFLRGHLSPSYRVEVVDTVDHWAAAYLPDAGIPIARGWFRQDDFPRNGVLYRKLDRARYLTWLRSLGVRYVVLPDAPLDYSAEQEGALVAQGRAGLRLAFRSAHTTVYAVPSPHRIVTGPGRARVLDLGQNRITLVLGRPGRYRIATNWSPYWTTGSGCLTKGADGTVQLTTATRRGRAARPVGQRAGCACGSRRRRADSLRYAAARVSSQAVSARQPRAPNTSTSTGVSLTASDTPIATSIATITGLVRPLTPSQTRPASETRQRRTVCTAVVAPPHEMRSRRSRSSKSASGPPPTACVTWLEPPSSASTPTSTRPAPTTSATPAADPKRRDPHSREPRQEHGERRSGNEHAPSVCPCSARSHRDEQENPDRDRARHTHSGRGGEWRRQQEGLDLVRDAVEAAAAVRMRPDSGERVDFGPRREHHEVADEKRHDGRNERFAAETEQERPRSRREDEQHDDRRRIVNADRAQRERGSQCDWRGEYRRATGNRRACDECEHGEADKPGRERKRRTCPRIVSTSQPGVEAG